MSITSIRRGKGQTASRVSAVLSTTVAAVLLLAGLVACSSKPDQAPEAIVKQFLPKHVQVTDPSVASFYVKAEQPLMQEKVAKEIEEKRESGTLESLKNATYDFSRVEITVLDEKNEHVNYEPRDFVKVAAKGTYTVTVAGKSQEFQEDEIFILEAEDKEWKVTEQINPWKKI